MNRARAKVVQAAAVLFAERGYAGTTVREIAGQAGVTPGAVWRMFGGKASLYESAVKEALARHFSPEAFISLLCRSQSRASFTEEARKAVQEWQAHLPETAARLLVQAGCGDPAEAIVRLLAASLEQRSSCAAPEPAARLLIYSLFYLKLCLPGEKRAGRQALADAITGHWFRLVLPNE